VGVKWPELEDRHSPSSNAEVKKFVGSISPPHLTSSSPFARFEQKIYVLHFLFFIIILSGVRLSPLGTAAAIGLLYQPRMIDDGDYATVGGM
jgi:hypothetical protein